MTVDKDEQPSLWYFGFEEYEKVREPDKKSKAFAWTTAIGLQAVDGLTPSDYLLRTAKRNIEGNISIEEVHSIIEAYYQTEHDRNCETNDRTEEADIVSVRIAEILNDKTFSFRPTALQTIHEKLFRGIYKFAGKIRTYNITKKEWILDGDSVYYTDFNEIKMALDYDFEQEKNFDYASKNIQEVIEHLAHFISGIWQIHAFGEGNTRTAAVFTIKYLDKLGYKVNNNPFAENSWYFRNALVRSNYNSSKKEILPDFSFLIAFFENLLLGKNNEMKNRRMHIYWDKYNAINTENGTINAESGTINAESGTINAESGTINAESGTINAESGTINAENGTINAENGTINAENGTINAENGTINAENGTINAENGTINAESGTINTENGTIKHPDKMIISAIQSDPFITQESLAEELGIPLRTLKRHWKKLIDNGRIRRQGANKNGKWIIINAEE